MNLFCSFKTRPDIEYRGHATGVQPSASIIDVEMSFLASALTSAFPEGWKTLDPVVEIPELEFLFSDFFFTHFFFFFQAFLEVSVFLEKIFVFGTLGLGLSTLSLLLMSPGSGSWL